MRFKISTIIFVIVIIISVVFLVTDWVRAPTNNNQLSGTSATSSLSTYSADTSSWQTYSKMRPPFSIKYPADLTFSTSTIPTIDEPYLLELQFPKDIYFSTVLKDEVYVIVTASSTCPKIDQGGLVGDNVPQTLISSKGLSFVRNEVNDVAAGNRYQTIIYDTTKGDLCYRITFFDHGANGAGLYLSSSTEIQVADMTHDTELAKIEAIFSTLVGTFSF